MNHRMWFLIIKNRVLPYDLAILTSGYLLKKRKAGSQRAIYALLFIATSLTTAKREKQPKFSGLLSFKRKETLRHATAWMNLEDIMLS